MNQDIKKKWADALRSGDYRQGRGTLRRVRDGLSSEFCCLGVLCDLAVKDGVIPEPVATGGIFTDYLYAGSMVVLPSEVSEWAGLDSYNPVTTSGADLAALNDGGMPFANIAALIEKEF